MFPLLLLAFFFGAAAVLVVQYVLYKQWIAGAESGPSEEPEPVPHTRPTLPQELADMIANDDGLRNPTSCAFLNLMGSFIFSDLKDSLNVKRFLMRKMTAELEELLLSKVAGRVILDLTVRDYSLGSALPIFDNVSVERCRASDAGDVLEELDIAGDVKYNGGFHIAIDAMLVFGKSASVSVRINKLEGRVVLKFSRLPFTHWSFAFSKEPDMELEIKSTLAGQSLDQLTKLIRSQIRRSVRKKHTLPNYKVRYKPFFFRQEAQEAGKKAYLTVDDENLSQGQLKVEVVEATRLPKVQHATHLYCTLGVGKDAWTPSGASPRSRWEVQVLEVRRERVGAPIGAVFRELYEETDDERIALAVVASVEKYSSSFHCGLLKNDIILSINGTAVASNDHACNIVRTSPQRNLQFEIQRPPPGVSIDVVYSKNATGVQTTSSNTSMSSATASTTTTTASSTTSSFTTTTTGSGSGGGSGRESPVPPGRAAAVATATTAAASTGGVVGGLRYHYQASTDIDMDEYEIPNPESFEVGGSRQDAPLPTAGGTRSTDMDLDSWAVVDGNGVSRPIMLIRSTRAGSDVYDPEVGSLAKQTSCVPACADPSWKETFPFSLAADDQYLSVCVWAKLENSRKNLLIGYASIPVHDVAVECAAVQVGRHEQCYVLIPGIHLTANANRAALRAAGAITPGKLPTSARSWYEREYSGDVRIVFSHTPVPTSAAGCASGATTTTAESGSPRRATGSPTTSPQPQHSPTAATASGARGAATPSVPISPASPALSRNTSASAVASSSPANATVAMSSSPAAAAVAADTAVAGSDATSLLNRYDKNAVPTNSNGLRSRSGAISHHGPPADFGLSLPTNPAATYDPNSTGADRHHGHVASVSPNLERSRMQDTSSPRFSPQPTSKNATASSGEREWKRVRSKSSMALFQSSTPPARNHNARNHNATRQGRPRSSTATGHDFLSITLPIPTPCIVCGRKIFKKQCQRCQGCMGAAHTACALSGNATPCQQTPIATLYSSDSDTELASYETFSSEVSSEVRVRSSSTSPTTGTADRDPEASAAARDESLAKAAAAASIETDKLVREAGRGMYGDLPISLRREKLTEQIKRLQQEINNEKMKQGELLQQRRHTSVERHRTVIDECISHSNNKLEALTLLMLQYLSGLHDCEEATDS